ncbi:GIY-YIG nuclease family protein [Porphyrobacter sp. HT-58-2]|uniref:GIY-YIG nuclease family protein n=1 Tax=Porphyrobacter sp. HT-58-2 TaxID=2023229 RepID=UPI0011B0DA00|nr:GIY-YIG nuclease family protein [Porphyrobacter sp. HT-58-2]
MATPDVDRLGDVLRDYAALYLGRRCLTLEPRVELRGFWEFNTNIQNADEPGCYFLFDANDKLLYAGKASMRSSIGARVDAHFSWDGEELRPVNSAWRSAPVYLRTVVVSNPWEAASLEEYIIHHLNPPFNVAGRSKW